MIDFYAVLINTGAREVPMDSIKEVVEKAKSWAKFEPSIWMVATNLEAEDWYHRIRAVLHPEDKILVVKLALDQRHGWVPKIIVDWIQADHSASSGL